MGLTKNTNKMKIIKNIIIFNFCLLPLLLIISIWIDYPVILRKLMISSLISLFSFLITYTALHNSNKNNNDEEYRP